MKISCCLPAGATPGSCEVDHSKSRLADDALELSQRRHIVHHRLKYTPTDTPTAGTAVNTLKCKFTSRTKGYFALEDKRSSSKIIANYNSSECLRGSTICDNYGQKEINNCCGFCVGKYF